MINKCSTVIAANYIKDFLCIGSKCVDSCCVGWNIYINKKVYKKCKSYRKSDFKEKFNKHIKRFKKNSSDDKYGIINLNKQGFCPFLDVAGLCSIQKEVGQEYLSVVCNMYPRILNLINGKMELSAVTSCIEVARLVLFNQQGIEFEEISNYKINNDIIAPIKNVILNNSSFQYYFYEIRQFSIEIIKNRECELWERLIILGMFFQKLQQFINNNELFSITPLIKDYINMINKGAFKNSFDSIPRDTKMQIQFIKEISEMRIYFEELISTQYLNCFKEMLIGIDYVDNANLDQIEQNYNKNFENYYEPYMTKKDYILENYIVNLMYKNIFPYTENDVFAEYVKIILHYAYIKTHLIGMSGYYKESFGDNQVINLIYSFSRTVEHNDEYLNKVYKIIENRNLNNMAFMTILIKN